MSIKKKSARFLHSVSKHKNKNKRIMKEEKLNQEEQEDVQIENEDVVEDTENTTETEAQEAEVEEVDPLADAEEQIAKLKDQLLRTIAEFENYKKRTLKEKTELILNGGEKTITAILPVLDDFERALADTNTEDPVAIKEGMDLIFKKFIKTLEGLGVHRIETEDKDFDVDFHEAIAMVPGMGDEKKGKVIDCVQTGYMLNDKVIRHAKVAVGQ